VRASGFGPVSNRGIVRNTKQSFKLEIPQAWCVGTPSSGVVLIIVDSVRAS
jgi:hypothetical protein